MFKRQPLLQRSFVVLLGLVVFPAWAFGQITLRPGAEPGKAPRQDDRRAAEAQSLLEQIQAEIKANNERLQKLGAQIDGKSDSAELADGKLVQALESRIAELKQQLQSLKARREATEAAKKEKAPTAKPGEGLKIEGNVRVITIGEDGKIAEAKPGANKGGVVLNLRTSESPKLAPGQSLPNPWVDAEHQPPYKVIGPDGKEIKGAIVVPRQASFGTPKPKEGGVAELEEARQKLEMLMKQLQGTPGGAREKPAGPSIVPALQWLMHSPLPSGDVIPLARASYRLPGEKAEALASFLKANLRVAVLEMKFENGALTVTTSPEVLTTIGNLVKLIQGPPMGGGLAPATTLQRELREHK